jgi:hypothetical protein
MTPFSICFVAPAIEGALYSRFGLPSRLAHGGAEVQMALLGKGLADRGHQVTFLATGHTPALEREQIGTVNLVRIPIGPGTERHRDGASIQEWLRRGLRSVAPQLVYQRCAIPLTGRVAWECGKQGRRFIFAAANDRDLDGRIRQVLGLRRYLMYRYGLRRADLVIVQSRHQQNLLNSRRSKASLLLPSAFDLNDGDVPSPPASPLVIWVGQILAKKQPQELLSLARALPEVNFLAAGSSEIDPRLGAQFRQEADQLSNLEYRGQVPHAGMGDIYRKATLLLNTSIAEGLPNTFLEAWSRNIPVATLGIDPDGLLRDRKIGFVLDRQDSAGALRSLLADENRLHQAGTAGRIYLVGVHSLPSVLDTFESELQCLLSPR